MGCLIHSNEDFAYGYSAHYRRVAAIFDGRGDSRDSRQYSQAVCLANVEGMGIFFIIGFLGNHISSMAAIQRPCHFGSQHHCLDRRYNACVHGHVGLGDLEGASRMAQGFRYPVCHFGCAAGGHPWQTSFSYIEWFWPTRRYFDPDQLRELGHILRAFTPRAEVPPSGAYDVFRHDAWLGL